MLNIGGSRYTWPCNAECNQTIIGKKPSCDLWWTGRNHKPKPTACNKTTGLPWVGHDGFHNPSGQRDEHCGDQMTTVAVTLALAGYLQSSEAFLSTASEVVRTWFLDSATAMNPNLQYAAIKPPPYNGTGSGIIWSSNRWNSEMTDAGEKETPFWSQFLHENRHFTKTGSGQTYANLKINGVLYSGVACCGSQRRRRRRLGHGGRSRVAKMER